MGPRYTDDSFSNFAANMDAHDNKIPHRSLAISIAGPKG